MKDRMWKRVLICAIFYFLTHLISDSFISGWIGGALSIAAQALIWPHKTIRT